MVKAPAKTGTASNSSTEVTKIDHANNDKLCIKTPLDLMFIIVVIKFIDPNIDDIPAICKLKIAKSIAGVG